MKIDETLRSMVCRALKEDAGSRGDVTTKYFLPPDKNYSAAFVAKADGVLCGFSLADEVFRQAAPKAKVIWKLRDGQSFKSRAILAKIEGPREILTAERTALNFLQHLSGIATLTSRFAAKVRGTRARIFDTRKTLPGWRTLAKYAVRTGGGANHRMGLFDMAMLKDNHLAGWKTGSIGEEEGRKSVKAFRDRHPRIPIEIEAKNAGEIRLALALNADIVMLDNMSPAALREHIRFIRRTSPRTKIEVSGGVDLNSVARLARLGPDRISIGRLTHSAPALDISMKLL